MINAPRAVWCRHTLQFSGGTEEHRVRENAPWHQAGSDLCGGFEGLWKLCDVVAEIPLRFECTAFLVMKKLR
jgi:hypothetical protein